MKKYVLVVAGGKGLRMGKNLPKQFLPVGGKPILMHTIERFFNYDENITIILVLPSDHQPYWKSLCREYNFALPHRIATGGETRFHSVLNGLKDVHGDGLIAVHDGVRPFVSTEVIGNCFREAAQTGAAIPVLPLIESIRRYDEAGSHSVDRTRYCSVQTPQVFCSSLLREAYNQSFSGSFTDDASVVEGIGHAVSLVEGNRENIKITIPLDLSLGEIILSQSF